MARYAHGRHADTLKRRAAIRGIAVSKKMVAAAQSTYDGWEEYGISDEDMAKAIDAALKQLAGTTRATSRNWTLLANFVESRLQTCPPDDRKALTEQVGYLREMAVQERTRA